MNRCEMDHFSVEIDIYALYVVGMLRRLPSISEVEMSALQVVLALITSSGGIIY